MIFQMFCTNLCVPEGLMMKTLTKMGFSGKDLVKIVQARVDIPSFTLGSCEIRHYIHLGYKCTIFWVLFLFV